MRSLAAALALTVGLVSQAAPDAGPPSVAMADSPPRVPPTFVMTSEVRVASKIPKTSRPKTKVRPKAPKIALTGDLLDRLAHCESGADPQKNTGNGYLGAFQFLPATARALGLGSDPTVHSYETQKAAVAMIPLSAWPKQFPGCSRKLGVR
jgi:resuscitation-promoting factor RpfB